MRTSGHVIVAVLAVLLPCAVAAPRAHAQPAPPVVTVTPLPVGSGARAVAEGAFLAVADDATAASWNPAGLIQLERPEISVVGSSLWARSTWSSDDPAFGAEDGSWDAAGLNFASLTWPFRVGGRNFTASLSYHQVYDFGLDLAFSQKTSTPEEQTEMRVNAKSEGAVYRTTAAFAFAPVPAFAIGLAVNLYGDDPFRGYAWEIQTRAEGTDTVWDWPMDFSYDNVETVEDFKAWNAALGVLWDIWRRERRKLTIGAVLRTPYTASVTRTLSTSSSFDGGGFEGTESEGYKIDFPMSVGMGLNLTLSDAWSVALDAEWTDWSSFRQESDAGVESSPIGGGQPGKIDDTLGVRVGTEYLFFPGESVLALRGGIGYDPRPSLGDPDPVWALCLGGGWSRGHFSLDGAYQYRVVSDRSGSDYGLPASMSADITEHLLMLSVILYL